MRLVLNRLGDGRLEVVPGPRCLLQPGGSPYRHQEPSPRLAEEWIDRIQRFRGSVYVQDGAIPAGALDEAGRHVSAFDDENWHLCLLDPAGELQGCIRLKYYAQAPRLEDLHLFDLVGRMDPEIAP